MEDFVGLLGKKLSVQSKADKLRNGTKSKRVFWLFLLKGCVYSA